MVPDMSMILAHRHVPAKDVPGDVPGAPRYLRIPLKEEFECTGLTKMGLGNGTP